MTLTLARRPRLVAGAVVFTLAALAVAGWTFAPRGPSDASGRTGPRLAIAVVPPVERDVDPGSILEVGTLNDGFDRAALDRRPEVDDPTLMPAEAYAGEPWPTLEPVRMPPPTPVAYAPAPAEPVSDPLADGSRAFGFDRLQPDTAAERAARPDQAQPGLEWTTPLSTPSGSPGSNTEPSQ